MSGEGYKACKAIFDKLAPLTPGTSENITARQDLAELRDTNMPCSYIEVDFHDVAAVAKWIIENVEEIGEAIAKGICNHFGVKYVEKPKPVKTVYRVQVGAFENKADADALAALLKGAFVAQAVI